MLQSNRKSWRLRLAQGFKLLNSVKALGCILALIPSSAAASGWVAESQHFRVVMGQYTGFGADTVTSAALDLERFRKQFLLNGFGDLKNPATPLDVLLLPTTHHLHWLLRESPDSRTGGMTIRGEDHDLVILAMGTATDPGITLAHEYAHQLEDQQWPLWFKEGRAVYLAMLSSLHAKPYEMSPEAELLASLKQVSWHNWPDLIEAESGSPAAQAVHFQVQCWLLVHWLVQQEETAAVVRPGAARHFLSEMGSAGFSNALALHYRDLLQQLPDSQLPVFNVSDTVLRVFPAKSWEIPLFTSNVHRELGWLETARHELENLIEMFPDEGRIHSSYGALLIRQGKLHQAENHYQRALELGDQRIQIAYRYALLLMQPGDSPTTRAEQAVRYALLARDGMPHDPEHQLVLAQARMLQHDWSGAFRELQTLANFPGWFKRAQEEAHEIQRRREQVVGEIYAPVIAAGNPELLSIWQLPAGPAPWTEPKINTTATASSHFGPNQTTWTIHGRIGWVDCTEGQRKIIVVSPYERLVLIENPDHPPRLVNRPFRGKTVPCAGRGWVVAIKYNRFSGNNEPAGEILSIYF